MTPGRDRRLAVALALAAVLGAAGCHPGRPRPTSPAVLSSAAISPSADGLLAAVAARRHAVGSVRGIARISYESAEEKIGARHAVVVAAPDHFRLEVLSPFGALAVVTCDGRDLAVWERREHRTYRGPASAASFAAYAGVPVNVADAVSVLLGLPPERAATATPTILRDYVAGLVRVSVAIDGGRQEIWFPPDSSLPVASETTLGDAARVLRVEFSDYRTIDGVAFPLDIDMHLAPEGRRVRVQYEPPAIGAPVVGDLFRFPAREGVEELRLDEYPGEPS